MAIRQQSMTHATNSTNLADLLERVLDKGIVIMGDIKIKLVDIELLSIQIRLLICSVEKAQEMGIDWWSHRSPEWLEAPQKSMADTMEDVKVRMAGLEASSLASPATPVQSVMLEIPALD